MDPTLAGGPPVDEPGPIFEDVFDAERILSQRGKGAKLQYLMKWKGYPDSSNSWEPAKNIMDPRLLTEWKELQKQKKLHKAPRGRRSAQMKPEEGGTGDDEDGDDSTQVDSPTSTSTYSPAPSISAEPEVAPTPESPALVSAIKRSRPVSSSEQAPTPPPPMVMPIKITLKQQQKQLQVQQQQQQQQQQDDHPPPQKRIKEEPEDSNPNPVIVAATARQSVIIAPTKPNTVLSSGAINLIPQPMNPLANGIHNHKEPNAQPAPRPLQLNTASSPPKKENLAPKPDIIVTDITVKGLTFTIRESSTPIGFFNNNQATF